MTKKTATRRETKTETTPPNDFEAIYTAHQVHTLAQITLGQLAGGPVQNNPYSFGAQSAVAPGCVAQPLMYWYR